MSPDPTDSEPLVPPTADLAAALTREHREIDTGIEAFLAGSDRTSVQPLLGAMGALRRHIYLEETFLFPPLRTAGLMMPVLVMLREHGELWKAMDAVEHRLSPAGDADGDGDPQLLERCRSLLVMLDQHNSKEEPIIYPRADLDLTPSARKELVDFLRDGELPEGWLCQEARA